ncbi:MAG: PDZ domain-containing protein [Verrucomicrobiota bacterium]
MTHSSPPPGPRGKVGDTSAAQQQFLALFLRSEREIFRCVQKPELKAIARTPALPVLKTAASAPAVRDTTPRDWLGASVDNIADEGEMSAFGLPGVTGVLVLEIPESSALARMGLRKNDVIVTVNGARIADVAALLRQSPDLAARQTLSVGVSRNQKEIQLSPTP